MINSFISCDIETIGLTVDSSIIEIGVCAHVNGIYLTGSQLIRPDYIRSDNETLRWWDEQPNRKSVLDAAESSEITSLFDAWGLLLNQFNLTPSECKNHEWWFRGPQFDEAMLRHQGPELWDMRKVRCQRTLEALAIDMGCAPFSASEKIAGAKHSAGYDAENQARTIAHHLTFLKDRGGASQCE